MSELKCCKRCGAFTTCTTKGECCPECEWFDPIDNICMAIPEKTKGKSQKPAADEGSIESDDVDPDTFLFEDDDDEDEDLSDLPPERESSDDGFDDDDDW